MDAAFTAVFAEYSARLKRERDPVHSHAGQDFVGGRDELLLAVGEDTGRLLNMLIKTAGAHHIIEVGTSYGYSTLWLAEAARAVGGKVVSLESVERKVDYARAMMQKAGLADYVEFRVGDALASLAASDTPIDFVLLDLWKDLYVPCLELIHPRLRAGAVIAADNMLMPEFARRDATAYVAAVKSCAGMETVTVPIGSGVELSRFAGPS